MINLYLFGFWEGVARVVDIGGTMAAYNESLTPEEADIKALSSDWQAVGDDIRAAMNLYDKNQAE